MQFCDAIVLHFVKRRKQNMDFSFFFDSTNVFCASILFYFKIKHNFFFIMYTYNLLLSSIQFFHKHSFLILIRIAFQTWSFSSVCTLDAGRAFSFLYRILKRNILPVINCTQIFLILMKPTFFSHCWCR